MGNEIVSAGIAAGSLSGFAVSVILGLAGLIVGSFLALVSVRLPLGEGVVRGRSRCRSCSRPLPPWLLVPVASWLAVRGRCACQARISARYPLIEACSGLIGTWAGLQHGDPLMAVATALFGWQLLLIAVVDAEHYWLPDSLTIPLLLSGVVATWLLRPDALPEAILGTLAGFLSLWGVNRLYRLLRHRDGIGGGDPILFAAIGAWLGWRQLPLVLLVAAVGGLALVAALTISRRPLSPTDKLPFGSFLAVSAWLTWMLASS